MPLRAIQSGWAIELAFGAGLRVRAGQAQEAARLVGDVVEIEKAAALADDVEQIAVLARGGVGPFAGRAPSPTVLEPDEHGAPRCIADVTDQPVAAFAPTVGEVVAAYRLGLAREAMRQFGSVARHHAASRSPTRSIA